jgi:Family of unknown function (DUF5985)
MDTFLMGAIAMASFIAGLFFLRFWRDTRDRLFLIFAVAFWLLGATRLVLAIIQTGQGPVVAAHEEHTYVYWVRLTAFVLIVLAIVDKNRPRRSGVIDPKRGTT